jgi:translation initiation factor 6
MRVLKANFYGNSNLGLYGFATDKYCFIGKGLDKKILTKIEEVLSVPVYELTINSSPLIGVYCCGNEDVLLIPEIIKENEEEELRKFKINYVKVKTKFVALGNNLVIFKNKCLVNPETEKNFELYGFDVQRLDVNGKKVVGSCIIINKNGCLVSSDFENEDVEKIEKIFNMKSEIGSVNKGNTYVRSGIIANSKGYIVGNDTTGAEILRIESALK